MNLPTPATLFSLQGRVALVTGASRGLGLPIAETLAGAGAHVYVNARDPAGVDKAVASIRARGGMASPLPFDIGDEAACGKAIDAIVAAEGKIDILVNNAGIVGRGPVESLSTEIWRQVLATNVDGVFYLSRAAAAAMLPKGYGRIVNLASIQSIQARPGTSPYATSKHAVAGLTKVMAGELASRGITVNAVAPGYFKTELNDVLVNDPEFDRRLKDRTPAGRWGEPAEIGAAALFLASEAAGYINGHLLVVDGGFTIKI